VARALKIHLRGLYGYIESEQRLADVELIVATMGAEAGVD
jgi:hypothetical protein